jgi:hypothetical protein
MRGPFLKIASQTPGVMRKIGGDSVHLARRRSGTRSPRTIEEHIAATVIARMLAINDMAGDDTTLLAAITDIIEAAAEERAA